MQCSVFGANRCFFSYWIILRETKNFFIQLLLHNVGYVFAPVLCCVTITYVRKTPCLTDSSTNRFAFSSHNLIWQLIRISTFLSLFLLHIFQEKTNDIPNQFFFVGRNSKYQHDMLTPGTYLHASHDLCASSYCTTKSAWTTVAIDLQVLMFILWSM